MSKLEELLQGVDVEWKAIDDIIKVITAPCKVKKEIYKPIGKTPIIDQGKEYIAGYTDEKFETVIADEYILFGDHSEHIKYVNFSFIQGADGLKILKIKKDFPKYIYYCFLNFYNKEYSYKRHWTNAKNTLIPIPCPDNPEKSLAIQQEIVRVLDQFTETTNELTAKLANERFARKKQYEFYREQLFSFEEGNVEWKTMGDIGEFVRGNGLQKTDFTETGTGCIHYGQIYTFYGNCAFETRSFVSKELAMKLKKVRTGDLIITNTSENIEDVCKAVAWLGEDEIVTGGHACILKHNQNPKYLVYCTQVSQFYRQKRKLAKGTKVMDVSAKDLAKIKIPIPSLEEQERIVYLLDEFDRLHTAIEEELTNEIALRNQQYEYYREQLLSFSNENK